VRLGFASVIWEISAKATIEKGIAQINRGEGITITDKETFADRVSSAPQRARRAGPDSHSDWHV
jgi:hypothetical protein